MFNLNALRFYLFDFSDAHSAARSVAIWLTVAFSVTFLAMVFALKGDKRRVFLKFAFAFAVIYSCFTAITFFTFEYIENSENNEFVETLFVPMTLLLATIAVSALMLSFVRIKATYIFSGVIVGAALVFTLVMMGVHFASGKAADMNWITNNDVDSLGLYISAGVVTVLVVLFAFLADRGKRIGFSTRTISFAAVCIAMSFALSYLRILRMPQGGSITIASLLPLMIYSYMFGTRKGLFACMIYGLLQAVQDPYIIHPAQFLLDYPLAFGCVGLAGVFAHVKQWNNIPQLQFVLGAVVAAVCKFIMNYLSGVFAFSAFAGGQNPFIYSLVYQAGYVLPDFAIAIAVGIFVFSSKSFVSVMRRYDGDGKISR